jgi:hypothetical protein
MELSTTAKLRELNWVSITTGLHDLAAAWTRLRVDHLPLNGQTLESLQGDYRELLDAMPVSSATEIETALRQFTRGLRLKGDVVTATQRKYLQEYCAPPRFGQTRGCPVPTPSYDGSYEYLQPLIEAPHSPATVVSAGALYYVGAHRSLGAWWPTFTEELRDRFSQAHVRADWVDPGGRVTLERVLTLHSRYIAELVARSKAEPLVLAEADRPDYSDLPDEQTAGTWLDDLLADASADDESSWAAVPGAYRQHRH